MLWYSNGVIHQQAPLKHPDKPAEATSVAMATSHKVDVCSQTVATEILIVRKTLAYVCRTIRLFIYSRIMVSWNVWD